MERLAQPFQRAFTLAEAVELFRRLSAANDDGLERDAPRPLPSDFVAERVAANAPSAA